MNRLELKPTRKQRGWTQAKTAAYLGVSQSYLALLEGGKRQPGPKLARKAVKMLKLSATALPLPERLPMRVDSQRLAQQLGSLGYLGFAYLRATKKRNPAEVLLTALAQENLESRLTEALPWLLSFESTGIRGDAGKRGTRQSGRDSFNALSGLGFLRGKIARGPAGQGRHAMSSLAVAGGAGVVTTDKAAGSCGLAPAYRLETGTPAICPLNANCPFRGLIFFRP